MAKILPIEQLKGQQIDPKAAAQVQVPQNVTIINQTVVNTTTNNTTNTTNNVQNNNGSAAQASQPSNPIGLSVGVVLQLGNQLIINSPGRDQYRIADNRNQ